MEIHGDVMEYLHDSTWGLPPDIWGCPMENKLDDHWGYPHDFGNLRCIHWYLPIFVDRSGMVGLRPWRVGFGETNW